MSTLLEGNFQNIYKRNDSEFDGKKVSGGYYLQLAVGQTMDDGSTKLELVDVKTEKPSFYKPFIGKFLTLAVDIGFHTNGAGGLWYKALDADNNLRLSKPKTEQ